MVQLQRSIALKLKLHFIQLFIHSFTLFSSLFVRTIDIDFDRYGFVLHSPRVTERIEKSHQNTIKFRGKLNINRPRTRTIALFTTNTQLYWLRLIERRSFIVIVLFDLKEIGEVSIRHRAPHSIKFTGDLRFYNVIKCKQCTQFVYGCCVLENEK